MWCNRYHQPVNIKRSSKKYNEKTMQELFDRFRYEHVKNKELEENEEAYDLCKTLITANTSTYNNRKILNKKFDINLTRKDINNFKQKMKFNLIGNRTDPELLQIWIDEILNENPNNSIQIKLNEDGNLECLYIQTIQMKSWFEKYPNILHLDSTFKVNIENYQLYICMAQNANLRGVPVAYCLMTSGNKNNLEFFYSAMRDYNDLQQTQVVMQSDCETEREIVTNLRVDIHQGPSTKEAIFNGEEKVEKQQEMNINLEVLEQEHEMKLCDEHEEDLPSSELKQEEAAKDEEYQSLSKQKLVLSYSPVINPRGRPRGKTSLVSYTQKDNKIAPEKNNKRTYNQVSPDLKTYKYKRNKKIESVRDVYDNTMWLTDLHIYLFFELLHKQFPNINGLCGPAQIHLYTGSLENSIFIFNANNNHWLTIANLGSDNIWKIYDSLSYPKESLVKFFQDILPGKERVVLSFENVQQQVGGNDCGLFALAFATSLCYEDIPSSLFYDQKSLRNHYVNFIENNEIQRFPSKPKRGSTRNNCKLVDLYLN
ncbi:unnamed protein product [Rotaria sordida]|uniref:Ubiquitin-like protease family profile domain-containing protein n=1 Tax=Rotaria sordida TaxID=392033 RepID=A0A819Y3R0_9BILA|nr:unnamed protein product [Rotaria sordida]CAF4144184.1 unnamed protein product [Rotaria sordida]